MKQSIPDLYIQLNSLIFNPLIKLLTVSCKSRLYHHLLRCSALPATWLYSRSRDSRCTFRFHGFAHGCPRLYVRVFHEFTEFFDTCFHVKGLTLTHWSGRCPRRPKSHNYSSLYILSWCYESKKVESESWCYRHCENSLCIKQFTFLIKLNI
jgi:hypothetical protein